MQKLCPPPPKSLYPQKLQTCQLDLLPPAYHRKSWIDTGWYFLGSYDGWSYAWICKWNPPAAVDDDTVIIMQFLSMLSMSTLLVRLWMWSVAFCSFLLFCINQPWRPLELCKPRVVSTPHDPIVTHLNEVKTGEVEWLLGGYVQY
jgi:hypothetical protein